MSLSLKDIDGYADFLRDKKKSISEIAESIVNKVSEVGLKDNYDSTIVTPISNDGSVVSGGIQTVDEIDTYREYGTGIVGSENPHPDISSGWIYDVNEHGEKGWIYPKGDGTFGWTKGQIAQKKFYEATRNMERALPIIAKEEMKK